MSPTPHEIVIRKKGGFDRLALEPVARRALRAGQVRIAVAAIGVNYADAMVRKGLYKNADKYVGLPITPGFEVAGRVVEVDPTVTDLAVGDEVFAVTLFGGYTTELVVDRRLVFPRPAGWTAEQAAAFPSVFMTAWFALFELAHPRPGATLLVHSAAGGVGSALVQLGRIAGARVVGVVGATHKVEIARALGCDEVIDKSRQDLWKEAERIAPRGYDVILDANGPSTLKQSYDHLAPIGRLVIYGFHAMMKQTTSGRPDWIRLALDFLRTPRFSPFELTERNRSVMAFNLSDLFERQDILADAMRDLLGWVAEGRIAPPQTTLFPMAEVARAHEAIESGRTTGKLVLVTA
ncbi:MAG: zinc-binding dehydrogenase [Deltaproteobacteria bacterium]|nr:zinc-binding dehydrogenase [Deltaproteobacteria bacterium]